MTAQDSRAASMLPVPKWDAPPGSDSLNGQARNGTQIAVAVEGQDSPQAISHTATMGSSPAGTKASRSHLANDAQSRVAAADDFPGGHGLDDAQHGLAAGDQDSPQATIVATPIAGSPAGSKIARPATLSATTKADSPAGPDSLGGQSGGDLHPVPAAEGQDSLQANTHPVPSRPAPAGSKTSRSQVASDTHDDGAAADGFPGGHIRIATHASCAAGDQAPPAANDGSPPTVGSLLAEQAWPEEPSRDLAAAADTLYDIERLRIASENRLRQFTRGTGEVDKDGKQRGFGWDIRSPAVKAMAGLVADMNCQSDVAEKVLGKAPAKQKGCCLEHDAERNLTRALRAHPLGPWVTTQKGVGEKQGARLIAVLGDPYVRPAILLPDDTWEPMRPRNVAELWAYCGLKPGQKRRRGEKANWSADAKMRAWNIAGSMLKAGNRETYDRRKAATEGRIHTDACVRCGPSGKPAAAGTPWSDAHRHADALRVVSKELLKELWREARRIHLEAPVSGQSTVDIHYRRAADGD